MAKRETKTESKKRVSQKHECLSSCAGCPFHEMNVIDYHATPTLFNHWCVNEKYNEHHGGGIVPIYETTQRLAPPPPAWCEEIRPTFKV